MLLGFGPDLGLALYWTGPYSDLLIQDRAFPDLT